MKKFIILTILALLTSFSFASTPAKQTNVVIKTNLGDIELLLDNEKAPKTVANFVSYAQKGHYKNTIFHRVIPGFMIQGGGLNANMIEKNTDAPIINEAANKLKNDIGTIAMARTADPNSATSQFFINVNNNDFLNYKNNTPQGIGYAVFGRVTKGMNVVNQITKQATTTKGPHENVPTKAITILDVVILK